MNCSRSYFAIWSEPKLDESDSSDKYDRIALQQPSPTLSDDISFVESTSSLPVSRMRSWSMFLSVKSADLHSETTMSHLSMSCLTLSRSVSVVPEAGTRHSFTPVWISRASRLENRSLSRNSVTPRNFAFGS
ncbi:hypothetical protein OGAPHI_000959 [Ogataea philodendri]|uniref:Uncharacterized protein n=1 Tax=Ogataea philodendri TaxID=1378263 RepID=A0A9P8T9C8_9ASCO|nr:uncharacterized protein OGAPHI_000959 [Ogataea philodendri]KAH3670444.1 hypothetical protein OGAPHI_000959 [Ogataea philodendri]